MSSVGIVTMVDRVDGNLLSDLLAVCFSSFSQLQAD